MPSIKCTAKLAKRAGFKLERPTQSTPNDWHANIFTFDRRFYVIFVHDKTRLTSLAGPVKKSDLQDLGNLLSGALEAVLVHEQFSPATINFALSRIQDMDISKTDNRSILGTINDNIFHIDYHAWAGGGVEAAGLAALSARVNNMPMSALKWTYAINEFRRSILQSAT
jgi:hypothetical protein